MTKKIKAALDIRYNRKEECITVSALKPKRFDHFGFGTFLQNITPGDIRITAAAKKVLLNLPERPGFQGMEFWPDKRLAWASLDENYMIPVGDINVPDGAKKWIKIL